MLRCLFLMLTALPWNAKGASYAANAGGMSGTCRLLSYEALPAIYDCTGNADFARVVELVRRACDGLGFPPAEGPQPADFIFVGLHYMAWIDNTGFAGKLNGLWPLNSDAQRLDFTLAEPTIHGKRPISMLLPGEDGDGRWPRAYNGAEHYELPRFIGEKHAFQAGIREANHFTDAPETWRQCINKDQDMLRWSKPVGQSSVEQRSDGALVFRNEAPLMVVARFIDSAPPCGTPFVFDNGLPGDLHLATGYVFYPNATRIERLYRFVNHAPYSLKTHGIEKLIGGLLLTGWPEPHYLKQFQRFISWDDQPLMRYTPLPYRGTGQTGDLINVHGSGSLWLFALEGFKPGRSIGMRQQIDNAGEDFGICLCAVHGGFELTGSVLADQTIAASLNGEAVKGVEQTRFFDIGEGYGTNFLRDISYHVLLARDATEGYHTVGKSRGAFLVAEPGREHGAGGFLFYRHDLPLQMGDVGQAAFYLKTDRVSGDNEPVVTIDLVWDRKIVLKSRQLHRRDFYTDNKQQRFVLNFQAPAHGLIEPRVQWWNKAAISLEAITINSISEPLTRLVIKAKQGGVHHDVGRLESDAWEASVLQDREGWLLYGFSVPVSHVTAIEAAFDISLARNRPEDGTIASIDLLIHKRDGTVLQGAMREIAPGEFQGQDGVRRFTLDASTGLDDVEVEPRVYWHGRADLKVDKVVLMKVDL